MLSRNLKILIAIIVVVVLPMVAALTWYWVTKDPTVRPLDITKRGLEDDKAVASSIGSYPASDASSGINAAAAYHMIVPSKTLGN